MCDTALYEAVELQMDMASAYLHPKRKAWIAELQEIFSKFYKAVAGENGEEVKLVFNGSLDSDAVGQVSLVSLLESSRRKDELVKHTTAGPHRDDIEMTLNGMAMRRTASEGQCKTFTTALRFAQYEFLHRASGMRPLLLLDDIFDKLDADRVERIMKLVTGDDFGQIFITDTNREHLAEIMSHTAGDYAMWKVSGGAFSKTDNN